MKLLHSFTRFPTLNRDRNYYVNIFEVGEWDPDQERALVRYNFPENPPRFEQPEDTPNPSATYEGYLSRRHGSWYREDINFIRNDYTDRAPRQGGPQPYSLISSGYGLNNGNFS
jgi:hypothetical protein